MSKILQGKIVSNKMTRTVVVEVERIIPHPLFKKLLKRSKKFKVATNGQKVEIGERVKIMETCPVAKNKHFALISDENKSVIPARVADAPRGTGIQLNQDIKTKVLTKKGKKA